MLRRVVDGPRKMAVPRESYQRPTPRNSGRADLRRMVRMTPNDRTPPGFDVEKLDRRPGRRPGNRGSPARVVQHQHTAAAAGTNHGKMVGVPEFISRPAQANARQTRSRI